MDSLIFLSVIISKTNINLNQFCFHGLEENKFGIETLCILTFGAKHDRKFIKKKISYCFFRKKHGCTVQSQTYNNQDCNAIRTKVLKNNKLFKKSTQVNKIF